jgi:centriolar protein POC1
MAVSTLIQIQQKWAFSGHQHPIYALALDQERNYVYSAGADKGIVAWDLKKGIFEQVVFPIPQSAYSMIFIAEKQWLAVGMVHGEVWLVDVVTKKRIAVLAFHQKAIFSLQYVPYKDELLVGSEDGQLSVWSMKSFQNRYAIQLSSQSIRVMAVHEEERLLFFGDKLGQIGVLDVTDYHEIKRWQAHTGSVTALQIAPDGKTILSAGRDAQLCIYQVDNFQLKHQFVPHMHAVYEIVFLPQLPLFATVSRDKAIKLWDIETYRLLKTISRERGDLTHARSINAAVWHPIANDLITASDDHMVLVWNVQMPSLSATGLGR